MTWHPGFEWNKFKTNKTRMPRVDQQLVTKANSRTASMPWDSEKDLKESKDEHSILHSLKVKIDQNTLVEKGTVIIHCSFR